MRQLRQRPETTKTFEILVEDEAGDEPEGIVRFEFNRNLPNIVPEEDIVLNYELASYIHRDNFHRIYQAVVEDAGYEPVHYSYSEENLFSKNNIHYSGQLSESGYNNHLNTPGYKPAYSDLLAKLEELNSKLTLVDSTLIFKAGQTTENESLVVRVEGELPEFINLVSPDLMVDDDPDDWGPSPSSFTHHLRVGTELVDYLSYDDVSVQPQMAIGPISNENMTA